MRAESAASTPEFGPADAVAEPFLMAVEDVFPRPGGRAAVITGRIERGSVRAGDTLASIGHGPDGLLRIAGVETLRQRVERATAGMNVGLLVGLATRAVPACRGQVLAAPGSIAAYDRFTADLTLLPEAHGGAEVHDGDRLQFHVRSAAVLGTVRLVPPGTVPLPPSHGGTVTVALDHAVPLDPGTRFAVRHHGRAAGQGTVLTLLPRAVPPDDKVQ